MTKLELINKLILQWFFIRLTKHMGKDKDGKYTIVKNGAYNTGYSPYQDGGVSIYI